MEHSEILRLAEQEGFRAALIDTASVPVDAKFRQFCEENRCGQYNANYSCPPTCGSPEEMHKQILSGTMALVVQSEWPINGYEDSEGIRHGKCAHNAAMLRLNEQLRKAGYSGLCAGGSCCSLCDPCRMAAGEACLHPELRFSCMSAYCVDVAELAKRCGLPFSWDTSRLSCFGMLILRKADSN